MTDASDDQTPEQAGSPPDGTDSESARGTPPSSQNDTPSNSQNDTRPNPQDDVPSGEDRERPAPEDVEEKYDFENFGPQDMAEMSYEEWNAAFDHDSWITGEALLDRLEADLKSRVADRDVFAVVERVEQDTAEQSSASNRTQSDDGEPRLVAYSDEGYAVVYPDGTVEGSGTVLRDVKPSIALASMESYEVPEMPEGDVLPDPAEVPEGTGQLGNQLMQVVGAVHVLAGVGLFVAWIALGLPIVASVAALGFLVFGVLVFLLVANARLSDRFRAEEYRNRLRAVGMADDERPEFLPGGDDDTSAGEGSEGGEGSESGEGGEGSETVKGSEAEGDRGDAYEDDEGDDRETENRPDGASERRNDGSTGAGVSSASEGGT